MPEVLIDKRDHIATITLNRPERLNAITFTMLEELSAALVDCNADRDVRVLILTGAGRGFCAGLDLKDTAEQRGIGAQSSSGYQMFDLRDAPPIVLHQLDKPVICAINGGAAGYGMDLALGCDIRIAADGAKLSAAFTKRGIVPESGGTWLLPRIVGWSLAAEIFFTGRTLDAQRCLELGLVSRVVPTEQLAAEARALAHEVAGNAPLAVQATKRLMRMAMDETFEANVHHVYLQLLPLFRTKDFQEGMLSFLEKRKAAFEGK
jgi:enoyl-CoA hydratase/carnithine racemase